MKKIQDISHDESLALQKEFEHWFQSLLGRVLLNSERQSIDNRIHRLFGYHQVDISVSHRLPVASCSMLGNKIVVVPEWQSGLPDNAIVSSSHELPFTHESCDLVVLHHTLDFSSNPYQSLREVSRILKSGGHVVIVGFNPISLWGLRRIFARSRNSVPWGARFISEKRLEDWLNILDIEMTSCDYAFYRWPSNRQFLNPLFEFIGQYVKLRLPMGAFYTLVAKKQVGGLIMNRPQWKTAKIVGLPITNRVQSRFSKH